MGVFHLCVSVSHRESLCMGGSSENILLITCILVGLFSFSFLQSYSFLQNHKSSFKKCGKRVGLCVTLVKKWLLAKYG